MSFMKRPLNSALLRLTKKVYEQGHPNAQKTLGRDAFLYRTAKASAYRIGATL
jgi:hypothetical protein